MKMSVSEFCVFIEQTLKLWRIFARLRKFRNFAPMEEKRTIKIDVCIIDPYMQNMQIVVPRNEYSYIPDSLEPEEFRAMTIRNVPFPVGTIPTHFVIDVPVPCTLNFETVKKAFQDEIDHRRYENQRIDKENRLNKRVPYEKYCEEKERQGRQPERLEYVKSWDLSKYGYNEQSHVSVPYGEVVSWSVIQQYE